MDKVTKDFTEYEVAYMKMLMNPFDNKSVKEPTCYPQHSKIIKATVKNVIQFDSTVFWMAVHFCPSKQLFDSASSVTPLTFYKYTDFPSGLYLTKTETFTAASPITASMVANNYAGVKLIAAGIRCRPLIENGGGGMSIIGVGNVIEDFSDASTAVTIDGVSYTTPISLMPIRYDYRIVTGLTTIAHAEKTYSFSEQPYSFLNDGQWMTTFYVPTTAQTAITQDKFHFYHTNSSQYPLGSNNWMYQGFHFPYSRTSNTNNILQFEATAVFEYINYSLAGFPQFHNHYDTVYKVAERLQNVPTYIGSEDNYRFSIPV